MDTVRDLWSDPTARRRWLSIVSGVLIVVGFGAGFVPALESLRVPLLFAAAIFAGSDIPCEPSQARVGDR